MKKNIILFLLSVLAFSLQAQQRGYYDAPYVRYEADEATLGGGATVQSSYNQDQITFEASDRTSVLANNGGSVTWNNVAGNFNKVGITLRFAIADGVNNRDGDVTRNVDLSINGTYITTLTLHSQWSWEHLWDNGNGNNNERILAMHRLGRSNMAIARELGLGVGEVKLVIDLYQNML